MTEQGWSPRLGLRRALHYLIAALVVLDLAGALYLRHLWILRHGASASPPTVRQLSLREQHQHPTSAPHSQTAAKKGERAPAQQTSQFDARIR